MQHWTKLVSEDKPPARSYQGAFCIEGPLTGQQHPLVMVVGGCDDGMKAFGDVWLLDVDRSVWSKVSILYVTVQPVTHKHVDSYRPFSREVMYCGWVHAGVQLFVHGVHWFTMSAVQAAL